MIEIKIKNKKGKKSFKYFPCRIKNYNQYRNKLQKVLEGNKNLYFEGVKDIHSGMFGILVKGTDIDDIRNINMFYSLRDINFFYYKNREREGNNVGNGKE